jgi:four helix bundle protein
MIPDELMDRLLDFSVHVGKVAEALPPTPLGRRIAREMVRSTLAAGPSYEEAFATQRRYEFTANLDGAVRELRRTRYWLRLVIKAGLLAELGMERLLAECTELCGIMEQSIAAGRAQAWRESQFGNWFASDLQFTVYGFQFATISMGVHRAAPPPVRAGPALGTKTE